MSDKFNPPFYLKNPFIQSVLASGKDLALQEKMDKLSSFHIIYAEKDTYLSGYYSKQKVGTKGLILLLHGWEGSSNSAYILSTAHYFYNKGYEIFRLTFRDHGDTQGLNLAPFHGALLDEVYSAILKIVEITNANSSYIIGFSIGGNFAARVALRNSKSMFRIPGLKHIFAISPSFSPMKSTQMMDNNRILRKYFLKHWRKSLSQKAKIFPEHYSLKDFYQSNTVMDLTSDLVKKYTSYRSVEEYFATYTLTESSFKNLKMPLTVLVSEDDPIVDIEDFYGLDGNPLLKLNIQKYGGHNGFIQNLNKDRWYLDWIWKELNNFY